MTQGTIASTEWLAERMRAQIRAALDAIITIDEQGMVVEWNPAAEQIFGYPADEAIGIELAQLIIPDDMIDLHRAGMARYFATGDGPALDQRLEMPGRRADGSDMTVELTITAFEADGRQWFTGYARDISELKRVRDSLELSEQRFRAIVEGSSDVITILNADGSWRFTSQSGARITGYPKGHAPQGGIFALLHPDDTEVALTAMQEVISGTRGPTEAVELRIVGADGQVHWFETTGVNMLDDPSVEGIVLHARDITDRRAADDAVRLRTGQMAGIMDSLDVAVLVEDENRRVVAANQAFADMFGSPVGAEDMKGADCVAAMHAARELFLDADGFVARIDQTVVGQEPARDELLPMADGRYLERDYVPVRDQGQTKGHIWLYRDVTSELEMTRRREEMLELERDTRRSLEQQNQALRDLDELKNQLVATVSHELRTPLASIVSFAGLMTDAETERTVDQTRFLDAITRNAHRLMQLVEDLLLLARLESNAIELLPEPIDLTALLSEVLENHRPTAEPRSIALTLEGTMERPFSGDRMKLIQVFDNLVSNAVKFTPDGGRVTVTTSATADGVEIAVRDTGMGVPAAELAGLFERFSRASNAKQAMVPGTGLGLAVTRGLVHLHGGEVSLESVEGTGTTVTVLLPTGSDHG